MIKQYTSLDEKRKFLQTCDINSSSELWDFVEECRKKHELVFRGVNEAKYMLYSSAQVRTDASMSQQAFELIISDAIRQVRCNNVLLDLLRKRSKDETNFQILSLLQHYGCGTPIIDFSTSIDAALFFATDRQENPVQTAALENKISITTYRFIFSIGKIRIIALYGEGRRACGRSSKRDYTALGIGIR